MKFLSPLILIAVAIVFFFWYINPTYTDVGLLRETAGQYEAAIARAQEVGIKRDDLVNRYNTVDSVNLNKLQKILPDQVDSVKLAVDINSLASKYGSSISDIKVADDPQLDQSLASGGTGTGNAYSAVSMSFTVKMTYENFLKFLADIEQSLRVTDISGVAFDAVDQTTLYQYGVNLKTYWLK